MKKIDVLIVFFFVLTSVYALNDLFIPGFFTSHDGPHQIVRAYYYDLLLREGQIPPRWVSGLNYGFGYPLFIFSYHIPWLMAIPFRLSGMPVIDSVKMVFLSGFILSGIFMYFYQKNLFGRLAAFVGSIIYLYAPFRFSNIFVRAALGDASVFIFAPLLFWSFHSLSKKISPLPLIGISVSLTALLLSHAMVFLFYLFAFSLFVAISLFLSKNKKKLIFSVFISVLLFICYSSFYLLPSFLERSFTKFDTTLAILLNNIKFVPFSKLVYSPWGYGTIDAQYGSMSLSIGIAQILIVLSAAGLIIYRLLSQKSAKKGTNIQGGIFLLIFALSIFVMTPLSKSVWQLLSKFIVIDYNWRILTLTVFSASMLSGWFFQNISIGRKKAAFLGFLFLFLAFYTNRNHLRINKSLDWSLPFFLKLEQTTNSFDEYMPKWANESLIKDNSPKFYPKEEITINLLKEKNDLLEFNADVKKNAEVRLNSLYYPGWAAYVDGKKTEIKYENENSGIIQFPVKAGSHSIKIIFEKTPLRKFSDLVTASSLLITVLFLVKKKIYG